MNGTGLQEWLNQHGADLKVDGVVGPQTRAAILMAFSNKSAPAVSPGEVARFAAALGVSERQLRAVAKVESGGKAFDLEGRPKILFERHYFHRLTDGKWSPSVFSDPSPGEYSFPSWGKLCLAASRDPDAAFASASWGRFQIMGAHWKALGYPSALEMAYSMVRSEAAHYEALVRFVKANGLIDEMRAISTDPRTCVAFAKAFNGPGYRANRYDEKLAAAMA